MRVSIFGLGYVGCISAVCLAEAGHDVVGVDINDEKVAMINAATPPIVEPGLEDALGSVMQTGRLHATVSCEKAVDASELALICVGTPGHGNGRMNLDALGRVSNDIGMALGRQRKPYTVVVRSTVIPGTTADLVTPALLAGTGDGYREDLKVAMNPEFMREGSALRDFLYPPFTIVGCDDVVTAGRLCELYANVSAPFIHTQLRTAEMVKYAANAFHALKISFANEIGDICEVLQVDAREVMRAFCLDKKLNISDAYLRPGFAFGGSCLPKDLRALSYVAHGADVDIPLLSTLLPANAARIRRAVDTIVATHKRRIGVLGLAFKSDT
ncbi:MAG: nucleotide sugar dehydrogenase, partial [Gammaproteobacteria bacterium]